MFLVLSVFYYTFNLILVGNSAQLINPQTPGIDTSSTESVSLPVGSDFNLRCFSLSTHPEEPLHIFWFRENNLPLKSSSSPGILQINPVEQSDAGKYTCNIVSKATGQIIFVKTVSLKVTGMVPPSRFGYDFFSAPEVSLPLGFQFSYGCNFTSTTEPIFYYWNRENRLPLKNDYDGDRRILVIKNLDKSDAGKYNCTVVSAITGKTLYSESFNLKISNTGNEIMLKQNTEPPPTPRFGSSLVEEVSVPLGLNVTIVCTFDSTAGPTVHHWTNPNNVLVQNNYRYNVNGGRLTINNFVASDVGIYTCVSVSATTGQTLSSISYDLKATATNILNCGKPLRSGGTPLISYGRPETYGHAPWHVSIYDIQKPNQPICGGTIISPKLVVSAAHCFYEEDIGTFSKPDNFEIVVSKYKSSNSEKDNLYTKIYKVEKIFSYDSGFTGSSTSYTADIAILKTMEDISMSEAVLPACLPSSDPSKLNVRDGRRLKVSGFGATETAISSNILRTTMLPFISRTRCFEPTNVSPDNKELVTFDKFCAGSKTGSGVLEGDSGGGLLLQDSEGVYYLEGIVSTRDSASSNSIVFAVDSRIHLPWLSNIKNLVEQRAL